MRFNNIIKKLLGIVFITTMVSCDSFLDKEPTSTIHPDQFLNTESQLENYLNGLYDGILPSHTPSTSWFGTFGFDGGTDNMVTKVQYNKFIPGELRTPQTGGDWEFGQIYRCNYFLDDVLPKFEAGKIDGNPKNIKHYIGEVYFLRAYENFEKLQALGDFPIVTENLPQDEQILIDATKRAPRTTLARFILSDLDKALGLTTGGEMLMDVSPDGRKNRVSKNVAYLFKSRVCLHEGTWLKYFKGTEFVPGNPKWIGNNSGNNSDFKFESGSIESEIAFFFEQAMASAKVVADAVPLVENNGVLQQSLEHAENPYFSMFGSEDLTKYAEVLMWKDYDKGLEITHGVTQFAARGNAGNGLSRGMVNTFLMENGLPIYAANSGYEGDDYIADVRKNRDGRLWLFLKQPKQKNVLIESVAGTQATLIEPVPEITGGSADKYYSTGYAIRKGLNYDAKHMDHFGSFTGSITFRAVEAYLNYMEASYEKNNSLDENARSYWKQIRQRARLNEDFNISVAATNMSEEAKYNWGAYSAGNLIDPTLYNIRRERNCELMAEGHRMMDLKRWRSLDQLITTPYHIEGFKIWGPMQDWYKGSDGNSILVSGNSSNANVSNPTDSKYLRPQEVGATLTYKQGGFKWAMAHYLSPIASENFLNTSNNGNDPETSPIYQNPGWSMSPNKGAEY